MAKFTGPYLEKKKQIHPTDQAKKRTNTYCKSLAPKFISILRARTTGVSPSLVTSLLATL